MELCSASGPGSGVQRFRDRLAHILSVPDVGVAISTPSGARVRKTRATPASNASTGGGSLELLAGWPVPG
eukprot:11925161-Heterocapsa_arctica.AAC.1